MSKRPIWDRSDLTNTRFEALQDIGPYVGKGSIFEITGQRPAGGIRPAHCTVHLYGSQLKMYITEAFLESLMKQYKLKEV